MRRLFTLLAALVWVISCGQAGGGSGTMAEGGIGGSGISTGPITDFGSIFVNDIEWFLDDTQIDLEGKDVECAGDDECRGFFRLGMVVRVEGKIDSKTGKGQAERVYFDDEIEGPVSQIVEVMDIGIPGQYRELAILGQRVRIEAGVTRFDDDDDDPDFGFNTIAVGDVVEISGLADYQGIVYATHVERRKGGLVLGSTEVELKGTVVGLAPGGSTFTIGSVTIDFDPTGNGTDLSDIPGGVLKDGDYVEVEGILTAVDRINAKKIELEDRFDDEDDSDDFSITGIVNDFTSLDAQFFVGNQRVDASRAGVEFRHGTSSMLANGRRVQVEGDIVDGVLIADEIGFEDQEIEIRAEIASADDIDTDNGRLVLLGIDVRIIPSTQFENSFNEEAPFSFGDLEAGDYVKVEGIANAQGVVTAFEVELENVGPVRLRGPVDEFNAGTGEIVILGLHVATNGATDFVIDNHSSGAAAFFARLVEGDFVEAKDDTGSATVLDLATEVELGDE